MSEYQYPLSTGRSNILGTEAFRNLLAKSLSKDVTKNITLWDERLSSQGAFNLVKELATNSSKKVKKLDKNAAQFILQGAIDYISRKNT